MVWKLFALLLFWEITGAVVYWAYITKFMMKLSKLDPNNDELVYEMLEMLSYGLLEAKKRDDESDAEHEKTNSRPNGKDDRGTVALDASEGLLCMAKGDGSGGTDHRTGIRNAQIRIRPRYQDKERGACLAMRRVPFFFRIQNRPLNEVMNNDN